MRKVYFILNQLVFWLPSLLAVYIADVVMQASNGYILFKSFKNYFLCLYELFLFVRMKRKYRTKETKLLFLDGKLGPFIDEFLAI